MRRGGRAARLAAARPVSDVSRRTPGSGPPAPLLVLACGALAREIRDLMEANAWGHVRLHALPAILHNHPGRIVPAVEAALDAIPHERALVAYADCGTGGDLARLCAAREVPMLPGAHCYAFYQGIAAFEARADADMRVFYLTDFLVRQFDAFVTRPLGLDRHPDLAATYFGGYERLVHLAQTEDAALTECARDIAARLGLAFERRATGYGDLAPLLAAEADR